MSQPKTNPRPTGLNGLEAKLIEIVALAGIRSEAVGLEDPDLTNLRAALRDWSMGEQKTPLSTEFMVASVDASLRTCRQSRRVRLKGMSEKLAVEELIHFLGTVAPATVAKAMGIAQSTLYSYSDRKRPNRPGPKRLYQASYLLRVQANALTELAEAISATARDSAPAVRGRSAETMPDIA